MSDLVFTLLVCIGVALVVNVIYILLLGKPYLTAKERIDRLTDELLKEQEEENRDDKH